MSGRLPLDRAVVVSVFVHVTTDGGVDAVFASLGGDVERGDEAPRNVTFEDHAWREAALTIGGVRVSISGPHHEIDTSVPDMDASAPALEIGATP